MKIKTFKQQAFWVTLEKAAHLGAGMGLLVAVPHLLGASALGVYAYVIAASAIFVPILDGGLHLRGLKLIAQDAQSLALSEALVWKMRVGPVVLALILLAAWLAHKPLDVVVMVGLVGLSTVAMGVGDAVTAAFKGLQRADYGAFLVLGTNVALLLGGLWLMPSGGVWALAWLYCVCRVVYAMVAWMWLRRVSPQVRVFFWTGWRWSVVWSGMQHLPMVYFVGVLLNVHFLTVDWLSEGQVSGAYAVGYRTTAALFALGGASLEMLLSVWSQKGMYCMDEMLGRSFLGVLLLGFLGAGLVHLGATEATHLLFGSDLGGAGGVVQVLGWSLPPFFLCGLCHTVLLVMNAARLAFGLMFGFVGVGSLFGLVGFYLLGPLGTVYATIGVGWLFVLVMGWVVWKNSGMALKIS